MALDCIYLEAFKVHCIGLRIKQSWTFQSRLAHLRSIKRATFNFADSIFARGCGIKDSFSPPLGAVYIYIRWPPSANWKCVFIKGCSVSHWRSARVADVGSYANFKHLEITSEAPLPHKLCTTESYESGAQKCKIPNMDILWSGPPFN